MQKHTHAIRVALFAAVTLAVCDSSGNAEELSRRQSDLFENHVRPTLVAHCIKCHGASKQEGGLKLTTIAEMISGGDSGPAVVPGNPDESLIIQAVRYESYEMPPEGPVDDDLVEGLTKWVAAGSPWPESLVLEPTPTISDEDREWWCYQPLAGVSPPANSSSESANEIDFFIREQLAERGLTPAESASPVELTRRVCFAITGLPPDAEALAAAMSDDFDYPRLVDRLLESNAYGENQARLWLDLVRYADTDGYRGDFARPNAFEYRDYVIRSFNEDKPYDRFVREQLAGDEIDPGNRDAIIATQYLRHWIYEHNQRDIETQWHEILSDITETTADVFLAQGLKCAKCHDHKFDPLLQNDYFRIKAFFAAFQPVAEHPVADADTRAEYQRKLQAWEEATSDLRRQLREIEYPVALEHATREGFDKFISEIKVMIKKPIDQREPYEKQIAAMAERQFDLPYDKLDDWLSKELIAKRKKLKASLAELENLKPKPLPTVKFVATDVGPVAPVTFNPDDHDKKTIEPGFITLLDETDAQISPTPTPIQTTGRRTALADWIVNPENPLTSRVIANRIWQQHFGRGLVATSSDFGRLGTPPTHPFLLDYLAKRLIDENWSLKKLHRLILMSAAYRQTSRRPLDPVTRRIDPTNKFLWRMNSRRLTGEEINDAILAASGELRNQKRAIYKLVIRNKPNPLLKAFDGPDRIRSSGRRHRTTTSTQSLLLANGDWAHARAEAISRRLSSDVSKVQDQSNIDRRFIQRVYPTLLARQATNEEIDSAAEFIQQYAKQTPAEPARPVAKLEKLAGDDGKAIRVTEKEQLQIKFKNEDLPRQDCFTIEAIVLLDSIYKDARVRTIAAHWNGSESNCGWSLGVTSQKSAFQPRNLILQLVGQPGHSKPVDKPGNDDTGGNAKRHYEVIASNLRIPLGKPCYVAVSIDLRDTSSDGITFYLTELHDPDAVIQTANATHTVTSSVHNEGEWFIGSRHGKHRWDGLIGNLRIENIRRDLTATGQARSAAGLPDYAVDFRFDDADFLGRDSSGNDRHASLAPPSPPAKTPRQRATDALVHALLNSNEFVYVD